jgi:4-alpha-glucanotransferase
LSVATNGNHDTETTVVWYAGLASKARDALARIPGLEGIAGRQKFDDAVRDGLLGVLYRAPSQLVITPFQDLFGHREAVNAPGTVSDLNWSYRMPAAIETLGEDAATAERLAALALEVGRKR